MGSIWSPTYIQIADEGARDEDLPRTCKTLHVLEPPTGLIFDFSSGGFLTAEILAGAGRKQVSLGWDLRTLRGRARLGAALISGGVAGILWEIFFNSVSE